MCPISLNVEHLPDVVKVKKMEFIHRSACSMNPLLFVDEYESRKSMDGFDAIMRGRDIVVCGGCSSGFKSCPTAFTVKVVVFVMASGR